MGNGDRPDGDIVVDGWTDEAGGSINIYQSARRVSVAERVAASVVQPRSPTLNCFFSRLTIRSKQGHYSITSSARAYGWRGSPTI